MTAQAKKGQRFPQVVDREKTGLEVKSRPMARESASETGPKDSVGVVGQMLLLGDDVKRCIRTVPRRKKSRASLKRIRGIVPLNMYKRLIINN